MTIQTKVATESGLVSEVLNVLETMSCISRSARSAVNNMGIPCHVSRIRCLSAIITTAHDIADGCCLRFSSPAMSSCDQCAFWLLTLACITYYFWMTAEESNAELPLDIPPWALKWRNSGNPWQYTRSGISKACSTTKCAVYYRMALIWKFSIYRRNKPE